MQAATGITAAAAARLGGPKNHSVRDVPVPDLEAVARVKGDSVTLYDAVHAAAMTRVNWDWDDMRIHLSPAMKSAFPSLAGRQAPGTKIALADFVWTVLEGRELPAGLTVATLTTNKYDMRAANLTLIPDKGRGQKPPADTRADPSVVGDIGMEFLPRGVSVSKDRAANIFLIKAGGDTKKFGFKSPEAAQDVFRAKVLPFLHAVNPNFAPDNAHFQRLSADYARVRAELLS